MAKKSKKKDMTPELAQAEDQVEAIKTEIAEALIQRNTLPKTATDEEKAAAAARVEQLQAQHHEAAQQVLAIKREETNKLEQEHKEKKLRHKQLKASRQPGSHTPPREEPAAPQRRMPAHPPLDRDAEEAQMDAANEEDLWLERQKLEEEDRDSADELKHQRRVADRRRRKETATKRREADERQQKQAEAKAEAARLEAEKDERNKLRKQAALKRAEEAQAKKRRQRDDRETRRREAQNANASGWLSGLLHQLKSLFGGPRT